MPKMRSIVIGLITIAILIASGFLVVSAQQFLTTSTNQYNWGWTFVLSLVLLVIFAVAVIAMLDAARWFGPHPGAIVAAFVASAPLIPSVAAGATMLAYVARWEPEPRPPWSIWVNDLAVLVGILAAFLTWPLFAALYRRFASADRANVRSYSELCERLEQLNAWLGKISAPDSLSKQMAYDEAVALRDVIAQELGRPPKDKDTPPSVGLAWVTSAGYINIWNRLHRAEEALMLLEPAETVVANALYDEWRIRYSTLDNREDLLDKLIAARKVLSVSKCFDEAPAQPQDPGLASIQLSDVQQQAADQARIKARQQAEAERRRDEPEARAILREVRHSLNEFRDNRRDGLVRARNRLIKSGTFTGLSGYVLLSLAITSGAPPRAIAAASALYLIGAIVGLFNRLLTEADSQEAVEDYGLTAARLIHTPLFSGLAAIGGVVLIALLPSALNIARLTPQAPTSAASTSIAIPSTSSTSLGTIGAPSASNVITATSESTATLETPTVPAEPNQPPEPLQRAVALSDIFDIQTYPFSIIIAAIFGLTPGLLVDQLKQQADQYKQDLKSTQASEHNTKSVT